MPLKKYKRVVIEKDMRAMYVEEVERVPDEKLKEIIEALQEVQGDFADAVGDFMYAAYIREKKNLMVEQTAYATLLFAMDQVAFLVPMYYTTTDEAGQQRLKVLIDNYAAHIHAALFFYPDFMELEKLEKHIKRCENRSKSHIIKISLLKESIAVMEAKLHKEGGALDPDSFDSNLISLSDIAGYRLTDDISLYEYGKRIFRARKESERINKSKRK